MNKAGRYILTGPDGMTRLTEWQGEHFFESGRVTDSYPVLDDNVEVHFTMHILGTEITRSLEDTSWTNITNFVYANLLNKIEVGIEFKIKS